MSELNFLHSNGNKVKLTTPDTLAASKTFKLPGADGSSGQFLKTDGSGALSFATALTTSWTEHATFDFTSTAASAATTTGIPSTARMVKINVFRLKHSASQVPYLRIGSSSGMHASGYTDIGTYQQNGQNGANYVQLQYTSGTGNTIIQQYLTKGNIADNTGFRGYIIYNSS